MLQQQSDILKHYALVRSILHICDGKRIYAQFNFFFFLQTNELTGATSSSVSLSGAYLG